MHLSSNLSQTKPQKKLNILGKLTKQHFIEEHQKAKEQYSFAFQQDGDIDSVLANYQDRTQVQHKIEEVSSQDDDSSEELKVKKVIIKEDARNKQAQRQAYFEKKGIQIRAEQEKRQKENQMRRRGKSEHQMREMEKATAQIISDVNKQGLKVDMEQWEEAQRFIEDEQIFNMQKYNALNKLSKSHSNHSENFQILQNLQQAQKSPFSQRNVILSNNNLLSIDPLKSENTKNQISVLNLNLNQTISQPNHLSIEHKLLDEPKTPSSQNYPISPLPLYKNSLSIPSGINLNFLNSLKSKPPLNSNSQNNNQNYREINSKSYCQFEDNSISSDKNQLQVSRKQLNHQRTIFKELLNQMEQATDKEDSQVKQANILLPNIRIFKDDTNPLPSNKRDKNTKKQRNCQVISYSLSKQNKNRLKKEDEQTIITKDDNKKETSETSVKESIQFNNNLEYSKSQENDILILDQIPFNLQLKQKDELLLIPAKSSSRYAQKEPNQKRRSKSHFGDQMKMKPPRLILNSNLSRDSNVFQDETLNEQISQKIASKSVKRDHTEETQNNSYVNLLEKMNKKDEKNVEEKRREIKINKESFSKKNINGYPSISPSNRSISSKRHPSIIHQAKSSHPMLISNLSKDSIIQCDKIHATFVDSTLETKQEQNRSISTLKQKKNNFKDSNIRKSLNQANLLYDKVKSKSESFAQLKDELLSLDIQKPSEKVRSRKNRILVNFQPLRAPLAVKQRLYNEFTDILAVCHPLNSLN